MKTGSGRQGQGAKEVSSVGLMGKNLFLIALWSVDSHGAENKIMLLLPVPPKSAAHSLCDRNGVIVQGEAIVWDQKHLSSFLQTNNANSFQNSSPPQAHLGSRSAAEFAPRLYTIFSLSEFILCTTAAPYPTFSAYRNFVGFKVAVESFKQCNKDDPLTRMEVLRQ